MNDQLRHRDVEGVIGERQILCRALPDVCPGERGRTAAANDGDGSTALTAAARLTSSAVSAPARSPHPAPAAPGRSQQGRQRHRSGSEYGP